ncbi:hypothetical protein TH61_04790 [Rufibacter sp. DG15C]|nr:hypothetical protein TH61_04790 [Rufibacter sp. DG15C]
MNSTEKSALFGIIFLLIFICFQCRYNSMFFSQSQKEACTREISFRGVVSAKYPNPSRKYILSVQAANSLNEGYYYSTTDTLEFQQFEIGDSIIKNASELTYRIIKKDTIITRVHNNSATCPMFVFK